MQPVVSTLHLQEITVSKMILINRAWSAVPEDSELVISFATVAHHSDAVMV